MAIGAFAFGAEGLDTIVEFWARWEKAFCTHFKPPQGAGLG